jgi:hypothetical protein
MEELDKIKNDNKKYMVKLRKMKRLWDGRYDRLNPKLRFNMRRTMDLISYGHLNKKEKDEFDRIECAI